MRTMSKRVTRRELAAALGAAAGMLGDAEAQETRPESDEAVAQRGLKRSHDALQAFKLPVETEPAFVFKA